MRQLTTSLKLPRWPFVLAALAAAPCALADGPGHFTRLDGHVTVEPAGGPKSDAAKDTELHWGDKVAGEAGSSALITLPDEELALVGPFEVTLTAPAKADALPLLKLLSGKLRLLVKKAVGDKGVDVVETSSAVMGVRGTDFFGSYEPLLGESEVICFDHELSFRGTAGGKPVRIKAGQWGGIGGRFGKTIKPPMNLPENVLSHFKALLPL